MNRSAIAKRQIASERNAVPNTLSAFVWKKTEASVCAGGGHAPFCASDAKQVFGACSIFNESSTPKKPNTEREMKTIRMISEINLI